MGVDLILILEKAAPVLATQILKFGAQNLPDFSPISKAIIATSDAFSGSSIEGVKDALTTWCRSQKFADLLEIFKERNLALEESRCVDSFIKVSGFECADGTKLVAYQILCKFGESLEKELFRSDEGLEIVAKRQEFYHEKTKQEIKKSNDVLVANLNASLEKHFLRLKTDLLSDTIENVRKEEITINARIDSARDLLGSGKPHAARGLLENIREEIKDKPISKEILFRIATNLGVCALELNEKQKANREFYKALGYQPDNTKALANAALGASLIGDYPQAISFCNQARELNRKDSHSTSILIQVLFMAGEVDVLDGLIKQEEWIASDPSCLLALGIVNLQKGEFEQAEGYANQCLQQIKNDEEVYKLLGDSIIRPIQKKIQENPPLRFRIDHITINRLEKVEQYYTNAIDILRDSEKKQKRHNILINRALVRSILSQDNCKAIEDCDWVLAEDGSNQAALLYKGLFNLEIHKYEDAIFWLKKLNGHTSELDIVLPLAHSYIESNKTSEAFDLLIPHWNPNSSDLNQIKIANLLLKICSNLGKTEEIANLINQLKENWVDEPEVLIVLANQKKRERDLEGCIKLLSEADTIKAGNDEFIRLELADAHYENNAFDQAAHFYQTIVNETHLNLVLNKYVVSLYKSGSDLEALRLAQKIRGDGAVIPVISEIEAYVLESAGNHREAKELWVKLAQLVPQNPTYKIEASRLAMGEDVNFAREMILAVNFKEISDNSVLLFQSAKLRTLLDLDDAIPFAYQARRIDFSIPESHLTYIGLFHRRHKRDHCLLDYEQVEVDTTVHLHEVDVDPCGQVKSIKNPKRHSFTILKEGSFKLQNDEIIESDYVAKLLLGRKKGDLIEFKKSSFENLSLQIVEIQSKYVFAFQQSLSDFSSRFPDHTGLYKVTIANNDFSKIFAAIDKRNTFVKEAMELYKTRQLTIGAFSKIIGVPLFDVWAGLVTRMDGIIFSSYGHETEKIHHFEILPNKPNLVLDLTALLTFASLNWLEKLQAEISEIIVPQSVLDEINEMLLEDFGDTAPSMVVWKEGDKYVRKDVTPEALEKRRDFLMGIRDFLKAKVNVVPTNTGLTIGREKYDELKSLFGRSSIDSILTAKEKGSLLFSDDLLLREVAKNDWNVDGIWSQPILKRMAEMRHITLNQYRESVKKLVLGNYQFVSLEADDLIFIFRENGWTANNEVIKFFSILYGPVCSDVSAVRVLGEFLKKAWLEVLLDRHKLWTLDLSLATLTTGRFGNRIIKKFIAEIEAQFAMLPLDRDLIIQQINLWMLSPRIIRH